MLNSSKNKKQNENQIEESDQFIVFILNDQEFGINVLKSREIITASDLTTIPESPDFIKGVINLREEIIPIVDLNTRFKLSGEINSRTDKVIIISVNNTLIGLGVKEVQEIIRIDPDNISQAPEITKGINKDYIKGIAQRDDDLIILLEINNIFSGKEINKLKNIE